MKLTMLGTGNALGTNYYNTCFVIEDEGSHFMADAGGGNGVLKQLKAAGYDWKDMRDIFVTHKHIDHIMGIIWMVRMICQNMYGGKYEGEARIYSHREVIELIRQMSMSLISSKHTGYIDKRLHLIPVEDGESRDIIGKKVTFYDINSTKAKQFGFSMELPGGEKLTCCGDEPCGESGRPYVKDSKWLLHEAFCLYSQRDEYNPYEKNHSTVKEACELAQELNVKNLVLYHTENNTFGSRKELYSKEGKEFYKGNLLIPDDLESITL